MSTPSVLLYQRKNYKDDDDKSTKYNAIRASVEKLANDVTEMTKVFTTVNNPMKQLKEADSDLYDSEEEDKASHFQFAKFNVARVV